MFCALIWKIWRSLKNFEGSYHLLDVLEVLDCAQWVGEEVPNDPEVSTLDETFM